MQHKLACRCEKIQGALELGGPSNHCICYCRDCRAFARFLDPKAESLDAQGGTQIVQILPRDLHFSSGAHLLACVRLSENGLLRWFASCCRTPIGNTANTPTMSFVGLIHSCLGVNTQSLELAFGPVSTVVHTKSALGSPQPIERGLPRAMARIAWWMLKARLSGDYRKTPFFRPDDGLPAVQPVVLNPDETARLRT